MKFSKICIEKPVITIVLSLILVLLGLLGFKQLSLRATPNVFRPKLVVMVEASGSSAEFMEKNITIPIENALQDTPYLSFSQSSSTQGFTQIKLYFKNISPQKFLSAQSFVLQAVNTVDLPTNAKQPEIRTSGHNDQQIMVFGVSSNQMNQHSLVDYVANNIVREIQQVQGVGNVEQWSTRDALRIAINPTKMAEYGITTQTVIDALQNNNISVQAGSVINTQQNIPVNLEARIKNLSGFRNIILQQSANRLIQLKDVATIKIDNTSFGGAYTFYNGKQGVAVSVTADDSANPILLGKRLSKTIHSMQNSLPPGMKLHVLWNQAKIIKHSVKEVFWTIFEAIFLVAVITLLFLGRFRFALIPVITIPICIISAFSIIWLLGFSINLMTLLALVLAVGLVVDDAIVVLENCHRHVEAGLSAWKAALKSMEEITFPVIGMTISIIAVYVPTAFMRGKTAVFFQQFAFTLAGAVFISGIIALTLTPMMCSRLMTKVTGSGYDAWLESFFKNLKIYYQTALSFVLNRRFLAFIVFVVVMIAGGFLFKSLPSTLVPKEYGGYVFLGIQTPQTASVAFTENIAKKVIHTLLEQPETQSIMSFGGGTGNSGNFGANMIRLSKNYQSFTQNVITAKKFSTLFPNLTDAKIFAVPMNVNGESGGGAQPGELDVYVTGLTSYQNLAENLKAFTKALEKTGKFQQVINNLKYDDQEININVNRQKAAKLGVKIADIDNTIGTYLGGYTFNNGFQFNGVNYPVIVQLAKVNLKDLSILNKIYVNNDANEKINLSRLIHASSSINLPERVHINGIRAGEIDVVAKPNLTMGQIINTLNTTAKNILPATLHLAYPQNVQDMLSGNHTLVLIFILGIVFIYLVLAALFESFIDPLIILLTVPLCIVGALLMLYLLGGSLNIYTGIGLVTLIGLVSKHGVLITQFANKLRKEKQLNVYEAVLEAANLRIRPILMTTATMVVGAVPLVLATSVGENARHQIGWVIIAGLILGTFFSLFIVPVAYTLLTKFKMK